MNHNTLLSTLSTYKTGMYLQKGYGYNLSPAAHGEVIATIIYLGKQYLYDTPIFVAQDGILYGKNATSSFWEIAGGCLGYTEVLARQEHPIDIMIDVYMKFIEKSIKVDSSIYSRVVPVLDSTGVIYRTGRAAAVLSWFKQVYPRLKCMYYAIPKDRDNLDGIVIRADHRVYAERVNLVIQIGNITYFDGRGVLKYG